LLEAIRVRLEELEGLVVWESR